jgi:hypothetical protein
MALTGCEEQVEASADRVNGEETSEPLPGLLMVGFAKAGTAVRASRELKSDSL